MLGDLTIIVTSVRKGLETVQTTRNIWINTQVLRTSVICVQRHFIRNEVEIITCLCILVFIGSPAMCVVKDLMTRTVITNTVMSTDAYKYTVCDFYMCRKHCPNILQLGKLYRLFNVCMLNITRITHPSCILLLALCHRPYVR